MESFFESLNAAQLDAVTSTEGPVRVIAGAGTGKTRALSGRFAFLVNEIGIMPGNILCVTFTNKAANEMRHRIHALTGDNDTGYVCTFHSLCVSILQEDSHAVQYPRSFLVLDNQDIDSMLGIIYEERGLTLRNMTFGKARDMIEMRKIYTETDYYLDMIQMSPEALKEKYDNATETSDIIFYGYLYQEKKCFGLDYNDLIRFTLYIFRENDDIRTKWQSRLEYIMIDEFQDIDDLQYTLMEELCGYHHNIFIVGDPDQTIYTWRGANIKYINEFDKTHDNTRTIMMMDNYRSTPGIISVANSLIEKNRHRLKKDLIPVLPPGERVICHHAATSADEAGWIASEIRKLHNKGEKYRDMAILYRAHHVTRNLEEVFIKEKIPYTIYSGTQFFDRREIRDVIAYMRMVAYKDDLSFMRIVNVPKRNIGKRRMGFLREYAENNSCSLYDALTASLDHELIKSTGAAGFCDLIDRYNAEYTTRSVSEILSDILFESGYEEMLRTEGSQERLDNLAELRQSVYEYETGCGEESTLEHYLAHVALYTGSDVTDDHDKVRLMTVHTAKGLEFPHVFLCAMNEGIFPSKKTDTVEGMEEERRLAFVAVTRAEKTLHISEAEGRNFDGSMRYPSRFILDIDPSLMTFEPRPDEDYLEKARTMIGLSGRYLRSSDPSDHFSKGQRVEHSVFKEGTILETDLERSSYKIQFDSMETPRNISFRANLKSI